MNDVHDPSGPDATDWLLRRQAGEDVEADPRFRAWLDESEANRASWRDALRVWSDFDEEPDMLLAAMRQVALTARPERRFMRPAFWGAGSAVAAAAAVLLTVHSGVLHTTASVTVTDKPLATLAYRTEIGDRQDVVLPDGSKVSLDGDTALTATLYKTHREIGLARGQAFFAVAHDAARPFTVTAADSKVTALGTEFDVLTREQGMQVLLVSGHVSVADGDRRLKLEPGERYDSAPGAGQVDRPDVHAVLAWRQGFIEFSGEPLGRAVDEMNRTTRHKIVVKDAGIAQLPMVTGRFKAGDSEHFARALGTIYSLTVVHLSDGSIELRRAR